MTSKIRYRMEDVLCICIRFMLRVKSNVESTWWPVLYKTEKRLIEWTVKFLSIGAQVIN